MLTHDPRELASIASIVLGEPVRDTGEVTEELLSRPDPAASATVAVYRCSGETPRPWSAVCKVLSPKREGHPNWRASADPAHWYWWRREEMAYTTGLLGRLTGGLRAPGYLNAFGRDGDVALWVEDVAAPRATTWDLDRYRECAGHLGRAQRAFAGDVPDHGWLARGFLAGYLDRHEAWFETYPSDWEVTAAAAALMADRRRLLGVLDEYPATLCHNDFHALNLFGEDGGPSIAVDWSFVGVGPLPVDAGAFAVDAVLDYGAPAERVGDLHEAIEDGFVAGLRSAGWRGDDARLRLAMRVVAGLKFAWVAPVVSDPAPELLDRWGARYGVPGEQVRDDWRGVAAWLAGIAAAAAARL